MKANAIILAVVANLGIANYVSADLLYDNGPMITHPGQGYGGADASALATGMGTFGFGMNPQAPWRVADDFMVPAGQNWDITQLKFYGYQTGSTTTSPFTGLTAEIWNGRPGDVGSAVVWGNLTDNLLTSSDFTGIYRVTSSTLTDSGRPIMELSADVSLSLPSGSYWLEWAASGSLASGPWVPPITIVGQPSTGNARRFSGSSWVDITDGQNSALQGLPFSLVGNNAQAVPEPSQWAMMGVVTAGIAGYVARRFRRKDQPIV
jgi:hypothetical protein